MGRDLPRPPASVRRKPSHLAPKSGWLQLSRLEEPLWTCQTMCPLGNLERGVRLMGGLRVGDVCFEGPSTSRGWAPGELEGGWVTLSLFLAQGPGLCGKMGSVVGSPHPSWPQADHCQTPSSFQPSFLTPRPHLALVRGFLQRRNAGRSTSHHSCCLPSVWE